MFFRTLAAALVGVAAFGIAGCGTSNPRFTAAGHGGSGSENSDEGTNESRFAAKIKSEEAREDDRKVDLEKIKRSIRNRPQPTGRYSNLAPQGINRDGVLLDVISYLGVPYLYGGNSKTGIDCSGFTLQVYGNSTHRALPRSVEEQFHAGKEVEKDSLQFGDLVFFNTTGESPSHVGIYIEDDLFAHASVSYGVTLSSLESTYYRRRFVGARRILR